MSITTDIAETCPRCHGWVYHRSEPCNCKPSPVPAAANPVQFRIGLGERLMARRHACQLSLDDLARRAGMSKAGLWAIEQGHNEPKAGTVVALAGALGVTTDYLLLGT